MNRLEKKYFQLLKKHGPQGWWPLLDCEGTNPTKTGSIRGYHPGDYSFPKNGRQRFEICVGAILTQNTAWPNVEKALQNLKKLGAISPKKILSMSDSMLAMAIRPSGYFNQKARKLKVFSRFYASLKGKAPSREALLALWGVGPETADSMLLYAYKTPVFVVDAYTKRIFPEFRHKQYEEIRSAFEKALKKSHELYQEYHALLVEEGKRLRNA